MQVKKQLSLADKIAMGQYASVREEKAAGKGPTSARKINPPPRPAPPTANLAASPKVAPPVAAA